MTPTKQSAAAVFTQFTDNGAGWPNMGATVLVGQVSSLSQQGPYCSLTLEQGLEHVRGTWSGLSGPHGRGSRERKHDCPEGDGRFFLLQPTFHVHSANHVSIHLEKRFLPGS